MKSETIEMLIEKGMQDGTFDIEIAQILNNEGVSLTFGKEGIEWRLEGNENAAKEKPEKSKEEDENDRFMANLLAYTGERQDEVKR